VIGKKDGGRSEVRHMGWVFIGMTGTTPAAEEQGRRLPTHHLLREEPIWWLIEYDRVSWESTTPLREREDNCERTNASGLRHFRSRVGTVRDLPPDRSEGKVSRGQTKEKGRRPSLRENVKVG
jgi:hypothetical protein